MVSLTIPPNRNGATRTTHIKMSVFNSIPITFVLLNADLSADFHKRFLCVREYYKASQGSLGALLCQFFKCPYTYATEYEETERTFQSILSYLRI
jgi:hypothetical protein